MAGHGSGRCQAIAPHRACRIRGRPDWMARVLLYHSLQHSPLARPPWGGSGGLLAFACLGLLIRLLSEGKQRPPAAVRARMGSAPLWSRNGAAHMGRAPPPFQALWHPGALCGGAITILPGSVPVGLPSCARTRPLPHGLPLTPFWSVLSASLLPRPRAAIGSGVVLPRPRSWQLSAAGPLGFPGQVSDAVPLLLQTCCWTGSRTLTRSL